MRLCLNMIVRDEAAIIERCLVSIAPWIDAWVICDTGSTDGTQAIATRLFAERGIPGLLTEAPFHDFSQARNAALDAARASALTFDALLLADADMELVVEAPDFARALTGAACQLRQRAAVSYWNLRLLRRDATARYVGATHEYLDVTGPTSACDGAWFIDHASGSSRPGKIARDTALLEAEIAADPRNARAWFYLAQTHRDGGRPLDAAHAYATRAALGGWEEEAWHARWQAARCRLATGDEAGFVTGALAAYAARPIRAEPLYDLAKYWRERRGYEAAMLFAEQGLAIPYPKDEALFVEDQVYLTGLAEEAAIAGYHSPDPSRRARGRVLCEALALDRKVAQSVGALARHNAGWYASREDWAAGTALATLPGEVTISGLAQAGDGVLALVRAPDGPSLARLDTRLLVVSWQRPPMLREPAALAEADCGPVLVRWLDRGALILPLDANAAGAIPAVATHFIAGATPLLGGVDRLALAGFEPWTVQDATGAERHATTPPWLMTGMTRGEAGLAFQGGWLVLAQEAETLAGRQALFSRLCWIDGAGLPSRLSARCGRIDALCWHPDGTHLVLASGAALRLIEAESVARALGLEPDAAQANASLPRS